MFALLIFLDVVFLFISIDIIIEIFTRTGNRFNVTQYCVSFYYIPVLLATVTKYTYVESFTSSTKITQI